MNIYIFSLPFSLLFAYIYTKSKNFTIKKFSLIISFLILFFIAALRVNVGTDYKNYQKIFTQYNYDVFTVWEPGYALINRVAYLLNKNFQLVIIVSAFIILVNVYIFLKDNSCDFFMSLLIYIAMAYYFQGMNIIRQWLAVSFALLGYKYINKSFIKFFIFVALGALFHKGIIIYIPVYFFINKKYKISYFLILSSILAIPLLFKEQALDFVLNFYRDSYRGSSYIFFNFDLKYIVYYFIIILVCFCFYKKLYLQGNQQYLLVNITFFVLCLYLFFGWLPLITRIIDFFAIYNTLLIPQIIRCFEFSKQRNFVRIVFIAMFITIFIYLLYFLNFHDVLPYQSILNISH